jgi:hypothetical protein
VVTSVNKDAEIGTGEEIIRQASLRRLSVIFGVPAEHLRPQLRFGTDLHATFVSDFRRNELDRLSDDIRDVADRSIAAEIESGSLMITTVAEYCDHMIRCSRSNGSEVRKLLSIT